MTKSSGMDGLGEEVLWLSSVGTRPLGRGGWCVCSEAVLCAVCRILRRGEPASVAISLVNAGISWHGASVSHLRASSHVHMLHSKRCVTAANYAHP